MNNPVLPPWLIDTTNFPDSGSMADKITFLLQYAVLAPSAHNTQPWRFGINRERLYVYRNDQYVLKAGDPTLRQTYLGIGACIENYCIAATHWGYDAEIKFTSFVTSENPIAIIAIRRKTVAESLLFPWLTKRHTNRGLYDDKRTPSVKALSREKTLGCAKLILITDLDKRVAVADLVGRSMSIGLSMSAMKEELSHFVHRHAKPSTTGMAIESMMKTDVAVGSRNGDPKNIIHNMSGQEQGQSWRDKFQKSPVICCISSRLDGPAAWVDSGRLLERVLLNATSLGLAHDICAAPIEIPTIWPQLRVLSGTTFRPQVLFRIGYVLDQEMTLYSTRRSANIS